MLGRLGSWRHVVVLLSIAACSVLALIGLIGGRGERFDAKQITVIPVASSEGGQPEGVRIREVVDQDFGVASRHGYLRIIPIDFGVPTDVEASSPDANADVIEDYENGDRRIRLGDPDEEFTGQHRYVLSYTLPAARLGTGVLDLDIIDAGEDFETGRFEVILSGFVLEDLQCDVGESGDTGGCDLQQTGDGEYRVVFEPLAEGDGVTVGGTITGYTTPSLPDEPPLPKRAADNRVKLALGMIPIGLVGGAGVYVINRRRGRNEVFSGGAAEAAYGRLPAPNADGTMPVASTRLVADSQMDELATIEFVPPKGIDPWQGAVLLREKIDDQTVSAWFSALVASEAITLDDSGKKLVLGTGRRLGELDPSNAAIVHQFLAGRSHIPLGSYDPLFASAWGAVKGQQTAAIRASGWWKRGAPGSGGSFGGVLVVLLTIAVFVGFSVGLSVLTKILGFAHSIPVALAIGLIVPVVAALAVYAAMLPARSATGSALVILTESFRRFLAASEGQHVDWAWKQGLLREYSAWAVALGAADAWGRALENSNVPPTTFGYGNPLLVYSMGSSFNSSHTAPSSSSSGGGGGGGGVGGGGGGGSSGSW